MGIPLLSGTGLTFAATSYIMKTFIENLAANAGMMWMQPIVSDAISSYIGNTTIPFTNS